MKVLVHWEDQPMPEAMEAEARIVTGVLLVTIPGMANGSALTVGVPLDTVPVITREIEAFDPGDLR